MKFKYTLNLAFALSLTAGFALRADDNASSQGTDQSQENPITSQEYSDEEMKNIKSMAREMLKASWCKTKSCKNHFTNMWMEMQMIENPDARALVAKKIEIETNLLKELEDEIKTDASKIDQAGKNLLAEGETKAKEIKEDIKQLFTPQDSSQENNN
jgi:hypothetical protein